MGIADGAAYCYACGQPQSVRASFREAGSGEAAPEDSTPEDVVLGDEVVEDARVLEPRAVSSPPRFIYAGFWLRLAAYILDSLLLGLVAGVAVFAPLISRGAISPDNLWVIYTGTSQQFVALRLLTLMIQWVYFALLESSPWQASVGKKMLGLVVTDMEGKRISFGRATARYFCTLLSGFILMAGFIMIAFTQKKQGLHDILTGCLVIKRV
jgi:uncharacterized RDD family membrane protein YckC